MASALVLAGALSGPAKAGPDNGWWWNPAESGRGFFIEVEDGQLFMAGYLYDTDGRARWLMSGGPVTDADNYSGALQQVNGGQSLFGDYRVPAGIADQGAISLHFTDATHGTLTWPGGTVPIQRQLFGSGATTFQPIGWWWNPDESGRGFSLEIQGDTLFMAGFMYDAGGNPIWYISSGTMTTPTSYRGPLQQIAGGQTLTGAYHFPTGSAVVGTVAIDFDSRESALLTLSAPSALLAKDGGRSVHIQPQFRRRAWSGSFFQEVVTVDAGGTTTVLWMGDVVFLRDSSSSNSAFYSADSGNYTVTVSGGFGGNCTQRGSFNSRFRGETGSVLNVSADNTFGAQLLPNPADNSLSLTLAFTCVPVSPPPITVPAGAFLQDLHLPMHGIINGGRIAGQNVTGPDTWAFALTPR